MQSSTVQSQFAALPACMLVVLVAISGCSSSDAESDCFTTAKDAHRQASAMVINLFRDAGESPRAAGEVYDTAAKACESVPLIRGYLMKMSRVSAYLDLSDSGLSFTIWGTAAEEMEHAIDNPDWVFEMQRKGITTPGEVLDLGQ